MHASVKVLEVENVYCAVCTSYIGEHLDCALKSGNSEDPPSISPGMRKTLRNQPAGTRPQQRNTTMMVSSQCTIHVVPQKWLTLLSPSGDLS